MSLSVEDRLDLHDVYIRSTRLITDKKLDEWLDLFLPDAIFFLGGAMGAPDMEVKGHVEIGDACRFRNNVILRTRDEGKIIFGDRSGCSANCTIEATTLIQIGAFTGIAENTVIRDTNHLVHGTAEHWRYTPHIAQPIIIGESCLIGSGVYIITLLSDNLICWKKVIIAR